MAVTQQEIRAAAARIKGHVHETPVMRSRFLDRNIEFKFEHTQITGSFKARGAFNSLLSQSVPRAGLVAASGGNHGAAVAHAAMALGHDAHIYVPELAGPAKIDVIRQTGASLHIVEGAYADAASAAAAYRDRTGALDIHPYDSPYTIAGQGTCFMEWEEQGLHADTILVAIGGGGLISGALSWCTGRKIVGVETKATATMHTALINGPEAEIAPSGNCANALGAKRIGRMPYDIACANNLQTVLVSDAEVTKARALIWSHLRQYVEPAGAAAVAALASGAYAPAKGEKVAVLLCGANPAPAPI